MADCDPTQVTQQWRFVPGLTPVKSGVNDEGSWCLDGGESWDMKQPITINKVGFLSSLASHVLVGRAFYGHREVLMDVAVSGGYRFADVVVHR